MSKLKRKLEWFLGDDAFRNLGNLVVVDLDDKRSAPIARTFHIMAHGPPPPPPPPPWTLKMSAQEYVNRYGEDGKHSALAIQHGGTVE